MMSTHHLFDSRYRTTRNGWLRVVFGVVRRTKCAPLFNFETSSVCRCRPAGCRSAQQRAGQGCRTRQREPIVSGEARTRLYSLWKRGSGRCSADGHAQGVCGGRLHFLSRGIRGRTDQGGGDEAGEPCNQRHDGERTRAIRNHRERLVANQGNKRKAKSKVGAWCGRLRVARFDRFMAAGRQGGRAVGRLVDRECRRGVAGPAACGAWTYTPRSSAPSTFADLHFSERLTASSSRRFAARGRRFGGAGGAPGVGTAESG